MHDSFEGCIHYTPTYSNASLGEIDLRRVYDIQGRRRVEPNLNGEPFDATQISGGRVRLSRARHGFGC